MQIITAFGDSVLKGVVNAEGRLTVLKDSFTSLCARKLDVQIINKGIVGATVTKGIQVFERSRSIVSDSTCKNVILEFGGNDCDYDWDAVSTDPDRTAVPNNSMEIFASGYRELIRRVREAGKEPVLLSLPPIDPEKYFGWISAKRNADNILAFLGGRKQFLADWHETYNLEVFKTAYACGVKIIDITSCFLKTMNYGELFCIDGIHPNERGHELIAGEICRNLTQDPAGGLCL